MFLMLDSRKRAKNWARDAAKAKPGRVNGHGRLRFAIYLAILLIGLALGGFLRFSDTVAKLTPPPNPQADAIVVLTGGYLRIDQAVGLLESGVGKRLLISGVNPNTSADDIRKLARAPEALFNCCVDIGREALDTIGNASETAAWVRKHGYNRVLVVTNNYHMPRSLMELARTDPKTEYIAYPVINTDLKTANWIAKPHTLRAMLSEYAKLTLAQFRAGLGIAGHNGLRDTTVKANSSL